MVNVDGGKRQVSIEAEEENREMFFYKGLPCIILKKLNFILKAVLWGGGGEMKSYTAREETR